MIDAVDDGAGCSIGAGGLEAHSHVVQRFSGIQRKISLRLQKKAFQTLHDSSSISSINMTKKSPVCRAAAGGRIADMSYRSSHT
jgi:hypothetical protein